jgi:hypothetical protein
MRYTTFKTICSTLVLACTFSSVQAFSEAASNHKDSTYYLIFAARPAQLVPFSLGGHAFVTWGIRGGGDSILSVHTYGFFPNEKSKMVTMIAAEERGHLVRGFFKNSNRQRIRQMIVAVDAATWQQTLDASYDWNEVDYNLMESNCLSFMDQMADLAGMDTPRTTLALGYPRTPYAYMKKLRHINKGRHQLHLRVYDREEKVCANAYQVVEEE